MDITKENPMIGTDYKVKLKITGGGEQSMPLYELKLTFKPDLVIMSNFTLSELIKGSVEDMEGEEEAIQTIGELLVNLLNPFKLYAKLKVQYINDDYTVAVDYKYNKPE